MTQPATNLQPRYNFAPTTTIDVVIPRGGGKVKLEKMRLGPHPILVEEER